MRRSTLPPKQATLIRPSEQLRRGRLDLEGVDLSQPAAVREHLFGKILRVDRVQAEGREPLALELEDFVSAARGLSRPRVSGEDALRAVRLADQILRCVETHRWDAESVAAALPLAESASGLARSARVADRSLRQNTKTANG